MAAKASRRSNVGIGGLSDFDLMPGFCLFFPEEGKEELVDLYEVAGVTTEGMLKIVSERTGKPRRLSLGAYRDMMEAGECVKVPAGARVARAVSGQAVSPLLLGEGFNKASDALKAKLRPRMEYIARQRITREYVIAYDEAGHTQKTEGFLAGFVQEFQAEVRARIPDVTMDWFPSGTKLRVAINEAGRPGERPLSAFLSGPSKGGGKAWPEFVISLRDAAVAEYYHEDAPRLCDVIDTFHATFKEVADRLEKGGDPRPKRPSSSVIRNWINAAATPENVAQRDGKKISDGRHRAKGRSPLVASHVLQYVLIDHTLLDVWAKVVDHHGRTLFVQRPWMTLALDLHTRAILAVIVGFDPPSLSTVMACLRQCVKRKPWLTKRYGHLTGFTDMWGKPRFVVVDNAMEFTGTSFAPSLAMEGIDVIWAMVRGPTYKAQVERVFRTLNSLVIHRMPGAIRLPGHELSKLELEVKPPDEAEFTCREIAEILWQAAATVYHLEVHEGIGMAPALAWRKGIAKGQPTVNDMRHLEKSFGRVVKATLTTKGVQYKNFVFTDTVEVTRMLGALVRTMPKRSQSTRLLSSGKVPVTMTVFDDNASMVAIWDPSENQQILLWNTHALFTKDQSWLDVDVCKAFAERENLAFRTEDEQLAARRELAKRSKGAPKAKRTRVERNREARRLSTPRDVEVIEVVEGTAEASYNGMGDRAVVMGSASSETKGDRIVPKRPRRGGEAATRKAQESRNRARSQKRNAQGPSRTEGGTRVAGSTAPGELEDRFPMHLISERDAQAASLAEAALDTLEDDLEWK